MKKVKAYTILGTALALAMLWTAPAANAQQHTNMVLPVSLTSALDSKKLKVGDEVTMKTTASLDLPNGSTIPVGAKIVGHVTESKARSKGDSESSLGIAFEKVDLKDGKTLAISGVMQAVGPNPKLDAGQDSGVSYGSSMNQGITHNADMGEHSAAVQILNQQSVGVVALKHLTLGPDGVLKSDGKMVRLDMGSQVMLRAQVTGS